MAPETGTIAGFSDIGVYKGPTRESRLDDVQNLAEILGEDFLEVDMGKMADEERQFMIVDKESGKVYDIRNDKHVERLTESTILNQSTTDFGTQQSERPKQSVRKTMNSGWSEWWR